MRTIAFFMGLCLFLLTGKGAVCSSVHHDGYPFRSSKFTEEKQQPGYIHTASGHGIITEMPAKAERPDFIYDDREEDDDTNTAERKQRLLSPGCLPCFQTVHLSNTCNFPKDRQPTPGYLPGKYITLRVLRI